MKKIKTFFIFAIFMIVSVSSVYGLESTTVKGTIASNITIKMEREVCNFYDGRGNIIYPISYNETSYLPVRCAALLLGKNIEWDGSNQTISIEGNLENSQNNYKIDSINIWQDENNVYLTIRPDIILKVDGNIQTLTDGKGKTVYPIFYKNTIYVPVRFVGDISENEVNWDNSERSIYIGTYLTNIKDVSKEVDVFTVYDNCVDYKGSENTADEIGYFGYSEDAVYYECTNLEFPLHISTNDKNEKSIIYDMYFLQEKDNYSLVIKKNLCALTPHSKSSEFHSLWSDMYGCNFIYLSKNFPTRYEVMYNRYPEREDMTNAMVLNDIAEYEISLIKANYQGLNYLDINIEGLQKMVFQLMISDPEITMFSIDPKDLRTVIKE